MKRRYYRLLSIGLAATIAFTTCDITPDVAIAEDELENSGESNDLDALIDSGIVYIDENSSDQDAAEPLEDVAEGTPAAGAEDPAEGGDNSGSNSGNSGSTESGTAPTEGSGQSGDGSSTGDQSGQNPLDGTGLPGEGDNTQGGEGSGDETNSDLDDEDDLGESEGEEKEDGEEGEEGEEDEDKEEEDQEDETHEIVTETVTEEETEDPAPVFTISYVDVDGNELSDTEVTELSLSGNETISFDRGSEAVRKLDGYIYYEATSGDSIVTGVRRAETRAYSPDRSWDEWLDENGNAVDVTDESQIGSASSNDSDGDGTDSDGGSDQEGGNDNAPQVAKHVIHDVYVTSASYYMLYEDGEALIAGGNTGSDQADSEEGDNASSADSGQQEITFHYDEDLQFDLSMQVVDENDEAIEGYDELELPDFEEHLYFSRAPISKVRKRVKIGSTNRYYEISYFYSGARIGDNQISQIRKEENPRTNQMMYFVTYADGSGEGAADNNTDSEGIATNTGRSGSARAGEVQLKEDTVITLDYNKKDQVKTIYFYRDEDPDDPDYESEIEVTVELKSPEAVPDEAELVVTKITDEDQMALFLDALNQSDDNGGYHDLNTHLYDIAFMIDGADGGRVEFEPQAEDISVSIKFLQNQLTSENENAELKVQHLTLNDDVKADLDATIDVDAERTEAEDITVEEIEEFEESKEEREDSDEEDQVISFETDSFSIYAFVNTEVEKDLVASDGNTYRITVTYGYGSGIPANAELFVSEITESDSRFEEFVDRSVELLDVLHGSVRGAKAFDIKLRDPETEEEYQPTKDIKVSIESLNQAHDSYDNIDVVHFHGAADGRAEVMNSEVVSAASVGASNSDGNDGQGVSDRNGNDAEAVTFLTDSFSVYIVAYTVDFHWGEYTYSIAGEDEVLLSELLEKLGVDEITIEDIADVQFSNPRLIKVEKLSRIGDETSSSQTDSSADDSNGGSDTDWLLTSLYAFDTEESLTLTLTNRKTVTISVTDAEGDNNYKLTIKANSYKSEYTGNSLTGEIYGYEYDSDKNEYKYTGCEITGKLRDGDYISSVEFDGSQTQLGSSTNIPSKAIIKDAAGNDATNKYDIEYVNGTLTVTSWNNTGGVIISKTLEKFDGDLAAYKIIVNSSTILNGGKDEPLILKDTFSNGKSLSEDDDFSGEQSIIYSSIKIVGSDGVSYDFSGNTGTYTIPDGEKVTITYTTRVHGDVGKEVSFSNTAVLGRVDENNNFIEGAYATVTTTETITPTGSSIQGQGGVYYIDLFAYADGHMEQGLEGAVFRLLDSNMKPMTYPAGENAGKPITFTTDTNGYAKIELNEEKDGLSIHKNTVYYLEMITAPFREEDGKYIYYRKDSTYYSFVITDDADYTYGGVYSYFNGDVLKVRCYPQAQGVNVTKRFSGNYTLTDEQKEAITFTLQKEALNVAGNWINVESHTYAEFTYGVMNFSAGREGGPELEDNATYRVIEENALPEDLKDTVELNTSVSVSYQSEGKPVEDVTNEFYIDPDDKLQYSYNLTFTNEYSDNRLTIITLDEETGEFLPGSEFAVYSALDSTTVVKIYETGSDGSVTIKKNDEGAGYETNILYYAVQTAAPSGYVLPADPEKIYFYFSENSRTVPSGLPAGKSATDLSTSYNTVTIANSSDKVSIPVTVIWSSGEWPGDVGSVAVGLYQSVDGGEATPVNNSQGYRTVNLTSIETYNTTSFTDLPARNDEEKAITYSVSVDGVKDSGGNDITGQYAYTSSVSGTGWYVVTIKPANSVKIVKEWHAIDGTDESDTSHMPEVTVDLYRSTKKISGSNEGNLDQITRSELTAFLSDATLVRSDISITADSWSITVASLEKEDSEGHPYYYYALEHELDNQEDSYAITFATETEPQTITIKNKRTPNTVVIEADNQTMTYGGDIPTFTAHADVQENGSEVSVSDDPDEKGAYTATVINSSGVKTTFKFRLTCDYDSSRGVGTYDITPVAEGEGPTGYRVVYRPGTLTVNRAQVIITAGASKTYGEDDPSLVTITMGDSGDPIAPDDPIAFTVSREVGEDVGSYPITLTGEEDQGNYHVNYVRNDSEGNPYTFSIIPAAVTVTAENKSKQYGSEDPEFTATVEGLKNRDEASVIGYELTRAPGEDVGTYIITPTGEYIQGNYTVTYKTGEMYVTRADLTISVADAEKVYGDEDPEWEVTISGLQRDEDDGELTYEEQEDGSRIYSYTVNSGESEQTEPAEPLLKFRLSREEGEDITREDGDTTEVHKEYYEITIGPLSDDGNSDGETDSEEASDIQGNYSVTYENGELTITRAELTVTANNIVMAFGLSKDPLLTAEVTGWKNGDERNKPESAEDNGNIVWTYTRDDGTTTELLTFTLSREPGSEEGEYQITATGDEKQSNYLISYESATFNILSILDIDVAQSLVDYADTSASPSYQYTATLDLAGTGLNEYTSNGFEMKDGIPTITFTLPDTGKANVKTLKVPGGAKLTVRQDTENNDYTTALTLDRNSYSNPAGPTVCIIDSADTYHSINYTHSRISLPVEARAAVDQTEEGAKTLPGRKGALGIPEGVQEINDDFADKMLSICGYELPNDAYYVFDHASLYTLTGTAVEQNITGIQYDKESKNWKYSIDGVTYTNITDPNNVQIVLFYLPKFVCKIGEEKFYSLKAAMEYAQNNSQTTATIEMLIGDYSMRVSAEAVTIPEGYAITITTAEDGYEGAGTAVISRSQNLTSGHLFTNNGSLTLDNIVIDGKGVSASDAFIINNMAGAVLTVGEKATLQNTHGNNGGAIYVKDGTVTVNGMVTGNTATNGGAVYVNGGSVTVNGMVTGNTATNGGAVYQSGGTLTVSVGNGITNNKATNGGAVYMTGGTLTVSVENGITDNKATNGGAVYLTKGTVALSGSISENTATNGGAVYMSDGTVNLSDSSGSISSNSAASGGAAYMTGGTVNLSGSGVSGNSATIRGGAFCMEGGTVTVSGSGTLSNNTAGGNGGALYASGGTVTVSGGTVSGNSATNGGAFYYASPNTLSVFGGTLSGNSASNLGGAIYQGSGTVTLSGGTIGGTSDDSNTAINGAGLYSAAGIANISAVTITGNAATHGGAVGAGSAATLAFSGDAVITGNTMTTDGEPVASNVYLDADSDTVITTAGLGGNASIGVYVEDDLLDTRCDVGGIFGTYSSMTDSNVTKFTNDRRDLTAYFYNNKLIWTKPIKYAVRYLKYSDFLPSNSGRGSQIQGITTYYPHSATNAIYDLVTELMPSYSSKVNANYAYANCFADKADTGVFEQYLTHIKWVGDWESGGTPKWQFMHYDTDVTMPNTGETFIIYYSDATYISITNNSGYTLSVDPLKVLDMNALETGYGYPTVIDYRTADTLVPIKDSTSLIKDGKLVLEPSGYVKLLFPGSLGKPWSLSGSFAGVGSDATVSYTLDSLNTASAQKTLAGSVGEDGNLSFDLSGTTLSTAGKTYDILFGDSTPICKVEDADGEHPFSRLNDAWNYIKQNNLTTATIEMLMDYVQPGDDVLTLESGYKLTLTTAAAEGSEAAEGKAFTYTGDDPTRATISRDNDNNGAAVIYDAAENSGSALTLTNLIFDGKALAKTGNGGAVTARYCDVSIDNCYFKGYRAGRGGAVFVSRSDLLKVTNSQFYDCRSEVNVDKAGGGAIWTTARNLVVDNCEFQSCICTGTSQGQGGAVFHNIVDGRTFTFKEFDYDGGNASYASGYSLDTHSTVTNCRFYDCSVNGSAGGGMETDAMYVFIKGCEFINCSSNSGHGAGGLQIYARDQKEPKEDWYSLVEIYDTVFDNCRAENATWSQNQGSGGAMRCTAYETKLYNCQFKDAYCKSDGGAIAISNGNANKLEVYGCSFENCATAQIGGAIRCPVFTLVVGDYTDTEGNVIHTTFKNCTATGNGGAINQSRNTAGSSATLKIGSFENCVSTTGMGGALYTTAKALSITGLEDVVTFKSCTAAGNGGAVYHTGGTSETLTTCSFENCVSSTSGGAAFLDSANMTLSGMTVKDCNAVNQGGGLRISPSDTGAVLTNCEISNCYVTATTSQGGAIYNNNNSTVTLDSGKITNCSAASGGGIYMNNGTLNYYGVELSYCYASGNGGGIYAAGTVNAYGTIKNCAANQGGGIHSTTMNFNQNDTAMTIENCAAKPVTLNGDGTVTVSEELTADNMGGGIYKRSGNFTLSNDSTIRNCVAYSGGGIYQVKDNTQNGISGIASSCGFIADCTAVYGGALYMTGGDFNHRNGSGISNCTASEAGGGVYVAGGTFYNYDQAVIENCKAVGADGTYTEANLGGGIYQGGGTMYLRGNVGAKIDGCSAYDGGGIYHGAGTFELGNSGAQTGTVISNNTAQNNGGGVCHMSGTMAYKRGNNDPEIKLNAAQNGAGLYCAEGTILNMSGGIIDENHALTTGGGIAVGGSNTRLNFSGTVKVQDNTMGDEASPVRCNVYLDQDSNAVIYNGGTMNAASYIGVYASDDQDEDHGVSGMPFATYNSNTNNFNRYINDRRPYLYGVIGDTTNKQIKWCTFVCKITDGDGNLLYKDASGTPAVYEYVEQTTGGAFAALNVAGTPALYSNNEGEYVQYTGNVYQVQMLVPSYELISGRQIKLNENGNGRKITLTTAPAEPDELGFMYTGDPRFAATIVRTANTSTMVYVYNNNNYELTLRNITLDGGGFAATDGGGIVRVNGSNAVILDEGATLKNNHATNKDGGAVYLNDTGSQLNMKKGSVITDCSAGTSNGGGAYIKNGTFYMNGGEITNCTAANGGGVYLTESGKLYMDGEAKSGAVITGNNATTAGGGIQLQTANARTYFSGYCTVLNNTIGETTRCNVQLQQDSNLVINTNTNGLDSRSEIGVYTPGQENTKSVFDKHGVGSMPFGTRQQDNDKFYCFVNDRNVVLRGVKGPDSDQYIYWEGRPLLRVGKTVASDLDSDSKEEFTFTVQLTLSDEMKGKHFKSLHNTYGDMDFDQSGKATVTLKNGEAATASFPFEFFEKNVTYTVTENMAETDQQALSYTTSVWNLKGDRTLEGNSTTGVLGENIIAESNNSTSLSDVMFTNTRVTGDLTVSKKVVSEDVSDKENSEFAFRLELKDTTISKDYEITSKDADGSEEDSTLIFSSGVARFDLKHDESITIHGLPTDLEYTITEELTPTQKSHIRTQVAKDDREQQVYATSQRGVIGEKSTTVTVDGKEEKTYASEVEFINNFLEIVCKITNRNNELLYYREANGVLQPAIYSHLEDAFAQVNAGNLRTVTNGTVSGTLYIKMVVPEYTMENTAVLDSGRTVVLSTALPSDDEYPYNGGEDDGNGNVSVVTRGFTNGSMIKDSGALTIDKITLDGGSKANEPIVASANGGIVEVASNVRLTVNSGAKLMNSAVSGNGGAIYLPGGASLTMNGAIENCSAKDGGGVYAATGFNAISMNGSVTGCKATAGSGGAIYASDGSSVSLNAGSSFTGNSASANGGAVYSETNVVLRGVVGGTESGDGNTAGGNGGGIYMAGEKTFTMYAGSEIIGNHAAYGGGLYTDGVARIASGILKSNGAGKDGGGVYAGSGASVTVSGTAVLSGNAAGGNGGAIYDQGNVTFSGGTITENSAEVRGGAVYAAAASKFTMTGGTIGGTGTEYANRSPQGAVSTGENAVLTFSGNAVVRGNTNSDTTNPVAMNVYLGYDSNSIITTTGLGAGSDIGIYVADGTPEHDKDDAVSNPIYCDHGLPARPFGIYTGSNISRANLGHFVNDRDTTLNGMNGEKVSESESNYFVIWQGRGLQLQVSETKEDTDETSSAKVSGVAFELVNNVTGLKVWSGKSDENGLVTIPWGAEEKDGGAVVSFAPGSSYTLQETAANGTTVLPAGAWTLKIGRDNSVTWESQKTDDDDVNRLNGIRLPARADGKAYLGDTFGVYNDVKPTVTFNPMGGKLIDTEAKKARTDAVEFTPTETKHTYTITEPNPTWDSHVFKYWSTLEKKPEGGESGSGESGASGTEGAKGTAAEGAAETNTTGYFEYVRNDQILFFRGEEQTEFTKGKASGDITLYAQWDEVVCKITDRDGVLLYVDGSPAVYGTLEGGFTAYNNVKYFYYQNGSRATPRRIEMLVPTYEQKAAVTLERYKTALLTTAPVGDTDGYAYTGQAGTVAVITRGEGFDDDSMIADRGNLTLMNITLDGGKREVSCNGGIINLAGTSTRLNIASGATLRNSYVVAKTDQVAGNGGAVYANSGTVVEVSGGDISGNKAVNGGGLYIAGGTATLTDDAKIDRNETTGDGNWPNGNGAGVYLQSGTLTINGKAEISNNTAVGRGGAVCTSGGTVNISDSAVLHDNVARNDQGGGAVYLYQAVLNMSGGEIRANKVQNTKIVDGAETNVIYGEGGGVRLAQDSEFNLTGGTISGNEAGSGAGVYMHNNSKFNLSGGTISGNTAKEAGAGIYVNGIIDNNHPTLKLSGAPSFGGTGRGTDDSIVTKDGTGNYIGNYLTGELTGQTNGQKEYRQYRQDIYINGFTGKVSGASTAKPATSLVVAGALNVEAGSIWVATEKAGGEDNHYYMLKQFAVFESEAVRNELKNSGTLDTTLHAFRNAWDDSTTGCGADYLSGQEGDALTDGTSSWNCIYWTGGFDVAFRKVDGYGEPLDGAIFTLYRSNAAGTDILTEGGVQVAYQVSGDSGVKEDKTAQSSKVEAAAPVTVRCTENGGASVQEAKVYGDGFVVFDKIPPGTYFLKETQAPKLKPDDAASTLRYEAAEEIYKLVVDGKGYFTLYTAGSKGADGKPVWSVPDVEATKTKLVKVGDAYTLPGTAGASAEDTVGIYSVMNVSPLTRKVILKKVEAAGDPYKPLQGKQFRIYRADLSEYTEGQVSGGGYLSGTSGVYFIGELPYGVYYLEENADPSNIWFWLIVDESGAYMPGLTEAGGAVQYGSKEDAMTAAAAKLNALKSAASATGD